MLPPQPKLPICAWFQPTSNFPALVKLGINLVIGPELGNPAITDQAKWSKAAADAGLWVILKNPTLPLPENCYGFFISIDEPNGKGVMPSAIAAEAARLRAIDPTKPIILSLAGDKVTSANFRAVDQVKLYQDYSAPVDIITVDWYSKNRNATRYPTTFTGDAVKTLIAVTHKPVWAWLECNDQQLPPIALGEVNREPTPAEIKATVDYAIANGATGIGWFTTCDRGRYGWPASYFPQVNRIGLSMQPQYDMVRQINTSLTPVSQPADPAPPVVAAPDLTAVNARIDDLQKLVTEQAKIIADVATVAAQANSTLAKLKAAL